jgi:hypothetical protein
MAEFKMSTHTHGPTVGDLFALLASPVTRTDLEIAELLGTGVDPLRERMKDLRRRGILAGPIQSSGSIWTMHFATVVEARAAARRSGLDPDTAVVLREPFWKRPASAWNEAVGLASRSARRWMAPPG